MEHLLQVHQAYQIRRLHLSFTVFGLYLLEIEDIYVQHHHV